MLKSVDAIIEINPYSNPSGHVSQWAPLSGRVLKFSGVFNFVRNIFQNFVELKLRKKCIKSLPKVALNKVELKTDELEKPLFIATYLKGVFEISNKHELPLCVAIYLQSNQLISNFDFQEFSTWLQIVKSSLSFGVGTTSWCKKY